MSVSIPPLASVISEDQIGFAAEVIDSSGVADELEALIARPTGRPRGLPLRALLVALLLLATLDRPLHLKAATKLLYRDLPAHWRDQLGVVGRAETRKSFLARYRCVRYLFHSALQVIDPSLEAKNAILTAEAAAKRRKALSRAEVEKRRERLAAVLERLLDASVAICTDDELAGFTGSVGLDATPVPLYSRGPSRAAGTTASDPDGGWYVREGDHRQATGPTGKTYRKVAWALDATIVVSGRGPGSLPRHPNLVLGLSLAKPGEDPGGKGVALLASLRRRGYPAGYLGADRGYTQCLPEHFALPVAALGYRVVMDYKAADLGLQASSQGAVLVDGAFYCPAMPRGLVEASAEQRAGKIDDKTLKARIEARVPWRLTRHQGPDEDGYERYSCPALGDRPRLCCPLRDEDKAIGESPQRRSTRERSAPRARSRSPPTSGRAFARSSPLGESPGTTPTPPTATRSRG